MGSWLTPEGARGVARAMVLRLPELIWLEITYDNDPAFVDDLARALRADIGRIQRQHQGIAQKLADLARGRCITCGEKLCSLLFRLGSTRCADCRDAR